MSIPAPPPRGYTFRLAGRHLITGFLRPRAAMRDALAVGLNERKRLSLYATSLLLLVLPHPDVRAGFANYFDTVRASSDLSLYALGLVVVLALLGLMVWVLYTVECAVLHGAVLTVQGPGHPFATTRSVVALAAWITIPPIGIVMAAVVFFAGYPALMSASWIFDAIVISLVASYCVLCIAEGHGTSLTRSTVVVLVSIAMGIVADAVVDLGRDRLIDILHSLQPHHDSA